MSEPASRKRDRSRDASAPKASPKASSARQAGAGRPTVPSGEASRRAVRAAAAGQTGAEPSPAGQRERRTATSRDASQRPAPTGVARTRAQRPSARKPRRSRDASAGAGRPTIRSGDASTRGVGAVSAGGTGSGVASRDASRRVAQTEPVARSRAELAPAGKPTRSRNVSVTAAGERPELNRVGFVCPPCGRFVPTEVDGVVLRAGRGSPPRFCSPGCRQAAYRRRQAGVAEDVGLQLAGGRNRSLGGPKRGRR